MPLFSDRVLRVQILQEGHFWSVRSWKLGPESNNAAPGVNMICAIVFKIPIDPLSRRFALRVFTLVAICPKKYPAAMPMIWI
jgi:hypothetical protein